MVSRSEALNSVHAAGVDRPGDHRKTTTPPRADGWDEFESLLKTIHTQNFTRKLSFTYIHSRITPVIGIINKRRTLTRDFWGSEFCFSRFVCAVLGLRVALGKGYFRSRQLNALT